MTSLAFLPLFLDTFTSEKGIVIIITIIITIRIIITTLALIPGHGDRLLERMSRETHSWNISMKPQPYDEKTAFEVCSSVSSPSSADAVERTSEEETS
jgi:hypothetical protein